MRKRGTELRRRLDDAEGSLAYASGWEKPSKTSAYATRQLGGICAIAGNSGISPAIAGFHENILRKTIELGFVKH
jgi:hypothetical protein